MNLSRGRDSILRVHLHENVARGDRLVAGLDEHHSHPMPIDQGSVDVAVLLVLLGLHEVYLAGFGHERPDKRLFPLLHLHITVVAARPFEQSPAGDTFDQSVLIHFEVEVLVGLASTRRVDRVSGSPPGSVEILV